MTKLETGSKGTQTPETLQTAILSIEKAIQSGKLKPATAEKHYSQLLELKSDMEAFGTTKLKASYAKVLAMLEGSIPPSRRQEIQNAARFNAATRGIVGPEKTPIVSANLTLEGGTSGAGIRIDIQGQSGDHGFHGVAKLSEAETKLLVAYNRRVGNGGQVTFRLGGQYASATDAWIGKDALTMPRNMLDKKVGEIMAGIQFTQATTGKIAGVGAGMDVRKSFGGGRIGERSSIEPDGSIATEHFDLHSGMGIAPYGQVGIRMGTNGLTVITAGVEFQGYKNGTNRAMLFGDITYKTPGFNLSVGRDPNERWHGRGMAETNLRIGNSGDISIGGEVSRGPNGRTDLMVRASIPLQGKNEPSSAVGPSGTRTTTSFRVAATGATTERLAAQRPIAHVTDPKTIMHPLPPVVEPEVPVIDSLKPDDGQKVVDSQKPDTTQKPDPKKPDAPQKPEPEKPVDPKKTVDPVKPDPKKPDAPQKPEPKQQAEDPKKPAPKQGEVIQTDQKNAYVIKTYTDPQTGVKVEEYAVEIVETFKGWATRTRYQGFIEVSTPGTNFTNKTTVTREYNLIWNPQSASSMPTSGSSWISNTKLLPNQRDLAYIGGLWAQGKMYTADKWEWGGMPDVKPTVAATPVVKTIPVVGQGYSNYQSNYPNNQGSPNIPVGQGQSNYPTGQGQNTIYTAYINPNAQVNQVNQVKTSIPNGQGFSNYSNNQTQINTSTNQGSLITQINYQTELWQANKQKKGGK